MIRPIELTSEYERVAALPVRAWSVPDAERMADLLTAEYKTRTGSMRLRPIQAVMCADAYQVGGLFTGAGVGHGKTLTSAIIGTVLGAVTPLLFVPAGLRDKTLRKDLPDLRRHWAVHPRLRVASYESLSTANGAALLDEIKPDLIILDECHKLKDTRTARTRRFLRYMQANPATKIAALSGSITRKSLKNYWHLIGLALPEGSPLPYAIGEVERWADALDAGIEDFKRPAPGVLLNFCADDDATKPDEYDRPPDELTRARRGFRRRLCSTWGVVMTEESSIGTSLVISERKVVTPPSVEAALKELRTTWCTPNGDELEQAVDVWRHAREIACGFWYKWVPDPPPEWKAARKSWHKFVRYVLGHNRSGIDSPLQVAVAYPDAPELLDWAAVRDSYQINSVPFWIDYYLIADATKWLKEGDGIAWVEHRAVGEKLAELSGFPYYGGGPADSRRILDAKGPIIASIKAHGTGKNLQAYNRNLILSCPPAGDVWEQLIGRTHRYGQEADEVTIEVYLNAEELQAGFTKSLDDAKYIEYTTGQRQKLLYADKALCNW